MPVSTLTTRLAFASFAVQSFLYGLYLAVTLLSLFLLRRRTRDVKHPSSSRTANGLIFAGAWALIVCITAHWVCAFVRIFVAFFVWHEGQDPASYLSNELSIHAAQKVFLLATIVLWDVIMTYRLYVIFHDQRLVLAFPAMLFIGFLACATGVIVQLFKHDPMTLHSTGGHWIVSDYVLSLSLNIYNTSMIIWRIVRQSKRSSRSGGPSVSTSLAIFIESAAIGILHGVFFVATYIAQHPAHVFAVDCAPPISGLALAFINLRVALGIPHRASSRSDLSALSTIPGGLVFAAASDQQVHPVTLASREASGGGIDDRQVDAVGSSASLRVVAK